MQRGAWVGVLGMVALVGGALSGGPDVVGGVVFGVVALAASGVMLQRRAREIRQANGKEQEGAGRTQE